MRRTHHRQHTALTLACALALGVFSATATAQPRDVDEKALLLDTRGAPVTSGELCWHTSYGPAPMWTAGCHAEAPAPVAQYVAPAPAPIVVAAVAPVPVYEKVSLDADALFDFDKSELRPAGREALDDFVRNIQGITPATIKAVGHADRLGAAGYNQTLSEERVASVKAYLVSRGIEATQVQTSGMGDTQPMTKAGQCSGIKNAKLIACLQPDRRVEMEISGQRLRQ